jgi:hypothetical protein
MEQEYDYRRMAYYWRQSHERYQRYVEAHGLLCQECHGMGGETDVILDDGTGPWEPCGWCQGTGKVTRWVRGMWLRERQRLKRVRSQV